MICTVVTALCSNDFRTQATDGPHVVGSSRTVKKFNIPLDQMEVRSGSEDLVQPIAISSSKGANGVVTLFQIPT
jgi:hypothetical protein